MNKQLLALLFLGGSLACRKDKIREVEYIVGCASCEVTYRDDDQTQKHVAMQGSWKYRINVPGGQFVALTAQSTDSIGGVTASIRVDGSLFRTYTSNDTFALASVNGAVP